MTTSVTARHRRTVRFEDAGHAPVSEHQCLAPVDPACLKQAKRNNLCVTHQDGWPGCGWSRQWADSAFFPGERFSYTCPDELSPPRLGPTDTLRRMDA